EAARNLFVEVPGARGGRARGAGVEVELIAAVRP
ncbi:RidA family protein, partial [Pseudomonas aeruginosa]|nr:RidA family protein [Pseudomonas aeruginosa]